MTKITNIAKKLTVLPFIINVVVVIGTLGTWLIIGPMSLVYTLTGWPVVWLDIMDGNVIVNTWCGYVFLAGLISGVISFFIERITNKPII